MTDAGNRIEIGRQSHLRARLHDPDETVTPVAEAVSGPSLVDGEPTPRWVVRTARGVELVCEKRELSDQHPDAVYRVAREQAS